MQNLLKILEKYAYSLTFIIAFDFSESKKIIQKSINIVSPFPIIAQNEHVLGFTKIMISQSCYFFSRACPDGEGSRVIPEKRARPGIVDAMEKTARPVRRVCADRFVTALFIYSSLHPIIGAIICDFNLIIMRNR